MKRITFCIGLSVMSLLGYGQIGNQILTSIALGKYSDALEQINELPPSPELIQFKAIAFEGLSMWDSAVVYYSKLTNIDTQLAKKGLARCYESVGNSSKAIDLYKQILADDSLNANIITRYANLLRSSSLHKQALEQFLKLTELDSTCAKYWEMLGDQYKAMNMTVESTTAYNKAYLLNSKNLFVASKYFAQLIKSNVPFQYVYENILEAYQVDSTYMPILMLKGKVESDMKKYSQAEITFARIASLGDSSFFTLKNLAIAKHSNGSYLEAENLFKKAYEMDSTDFLLNFVYAKTLQNIGERNLALDIISNTIKLLYPSDELVASFYELAGDIYNSGNKIDLAVENYQMALEKDKKNELKYLNKIIWCKIYDKKFRDAEYLVHKYDSIILEKYADDSIQLKNEQRKTGFYKDLLKKEFFFMDDLKNGKFLVY